MRPWLLIDVDGPLNPFDAPWFVRGEAADGYEFHLLTPLGGPSYWVALNADHGRQLLRLAEWFELAWATTWRDDANRLIAPILGLPHDLPVIPLVGPTFHVALRCWKTDQIADWVGRRAFAWFDDEIDPPTRHWLGAQTGLGPHLALHVSPRTGLTPTDVEALERFGKSL